MLDVLTCHAYDACQKQAEAAPSSSKKRARLDAAPPKQSPMMYRRNAEAAERAKQRTQREDDAPRLHDEVPRLTDLKLEIAYRRADSEAAESTHIRRVVLERAPALFVMSCSNKECQGGGHDLTSTVMRGLRASETHFDGTSNCNGSVGTGSCNGILTWIADATYKPAK